MNKCTAALNSLTYAMKAQRALEDAAVRVKIVKLDSKMTNKGCAYGVEYPCEQYRNVRTILSASHIPVSKYINGGGGEEL